MEKRLSLDGLAAIIENTSRLLHANGHACGLYPAQWTALRYFAEAGVHQRTIGGLAKYQQMALSSVGRTVATLVEKGLVEKRNNPRDARADIIELTNAGRAMLEADPRRQLISALEQVEGEDLNAYARFATRLLQRLHEQRKAESEN